MTDYIGRWAVVPIIKPDGSFGEIRTDARVLARTRGQDAYAYRLGMEQLTAEVDAIWPAAVCQPWFKDWQPKQRSSFLATIDSQLKEVYSDMAESINRQLYGDSPMLHSIGEDASPFWTAELQPGGWRGRWRRLKRWLGKIR